MFGPFLNFYFALLLLFFFKSNELNHQTKLTIIGSGGLEILFNYF